MNKKYPILLRAIDSYDGHLIIGQIYHGCVEEGINARDKGYLVYWPSREKGENWIYAFRFEKIDPKNLTKLQLIVYDLNITKGRIT